LDLPDDDAEIYIELHKKHGAEEPVPFDANYGIYEADHNEEIYNSFVYHPMGKAVAVS
jgi:hypothetical protein